MELTGPPSFFKSDERPLVRTTTRVKSMSANEDIKARRGDSHVWYESHDFSKNEQATTFRRHSVTAVDRAAVKLHALLEGDDALPYLASLSSLRLFELPGSAGLTFGRKTD